MQNIELTQARLKEVLIYFKTTGQFKWRVRQGTAKAGEIAGSNARGYLRIHIDGRDYFAHRLAWLYVHGHMPPFLLDHKNHNKADNRIGNLRLATKAQNAQNTRSILTKSRSGLIGAAWSSQLGKWLSRIRIDGKKIYLGVFTTPEKAHAAYLVAKRKYHSFNTL